MSVDDIEPLVRNDTIAIIPLHSNQEPTSIAGHG